MPNNNTANQINWRSQVNRGSYFLQQPYDVESNLFALKHGHCNGNTNVLLSVLDGANSQGLLDDDDCDDDLEFFTTTCREVFENTQSVFSNLGGARNTSVACAWYEKKDWRIRIAAERIREVLLEELRTQTVVLSIAANELSAFMQATSAADNEIIVDPILDDGSGCVSPVDDLARASSLIVDRLPFEDPASLSKLLQVAEG